MAITLNINSTDRTSLVVDKTLTGTLNLTSQVDVVEFHIRKYKAGVTYTPAIGDVVELIDDGTTVFGGEVINIQQSVESSVAGVYYSIRAVDYSRKLIDTVFTETYENDTIEDIIDDINTNYLSGFTVNNVVCNVSIDKIVFNQVSVFDAIRKLADLVAYHWYVDPNKDIHFFSKFTNSAPFSITDDNGKYIPKSLKYKVDGSEIVNHIIVRGGEYDANSQTDVITVSGNDSKSFILPQKMSNLQVELDTGAGYVAQAVGIEFIDDFTTKDVLYDYNQKSIRWNAALSDGDKIRFTGNPKAKVLAPAEDPTSIATYGRKSKVIIDKSIEDIDVARKRAAAELLKYKDEKAGIQVRTYETGLRAGQVITVNSTIQGINDQFLIQKVSFKMHGYDSFVYEAQLISTEEYGFIELLQALLRPEPAQENETEDQYEVKIDTNIVTVAESITQETPETDTATLSVAEDIQDDPIGSGVEPIWVLHYYFPASHSDTKRVGFLDRSLKVT